MNKNLRGLDDLILEEIKNQSFPGGNYCLVENDNVYFNTFGSKALYPKNEINNLNTAYDMASCTKVVVTTTAIMLLLEEGKLRLYDAVIKYIPQFKHDNITLWDLLTHTSGLPAGIAGSNEAKSKEELLEKMFSLELKYEKNTKIVYSDVGFILLGMVVEKISGLTLDLFAEKYIFEPLEMTNSHFNPKNKELCAPTEIRGEIVTRGEVHDEKALILGGVAGHAGLFSTVDDISKFIKMILHDGKYKNIQFLSKATIDLLFVPQVRETQGVSLVNEQRGLGWIVRGSFCSAGDLASEETILHTGFTGTNIFIDRINKVGFSLLTNRVHPTRDNVKIIPFRAKLGNYILSHFGKGNKNEI